MDLGNAPASNSFLTPAQLNEPEVFFPLKVYTCHKCFLVQVDEYKKSDTIFDGTYVYFSSYSKSWLAHSKRYADMMTDRFGYGRNSQVIEVASNDGYLLQYFNEKGINVLGIEPAANTAEAAKQKGIKSVVDFFGERLAKNLVSEGMGADLLIGNNVLAHVPDIIDFLKGAKTILKKDGVITFEFPHLMQLVEQNQFDTIYHEHFSYLSFTTVQKIFQSLGLDLFDVEELPTHGGSLRIFGKHADDKTKPISKNVIVMVKKEKDKGMRTRAYYAHLQERALAVKLEMLEFLTKQKHANKKVAAWGAAAKGNTLLNYCGIKSDLIEYVVDDSPHKQNKLLPGSHIPVVNEAYLKIHKPDYVIVLPWNLKNDMMAQLSYIKKWKGKFVVPIPSLKVI
jgi:SAM-dependent methyltransferase